MEQLYPAPTRNIIMFDTQTQFTCRSVTMDKCKQWLTVTCLGRMQGDRCVQWHNSADSPGKRNLKGKLCSPSFRVPGKQLDGDFKKHASCDHHYMCARDRDTWAPLSAIETELLKYCSSSIQSVSCALLVTPLTPWQFTLIAVWGND